MKRPNVKVRIKEKAIKNMSHAYLYLIASYGYAERRYDIDSQSFRIVRPPVEVATGHTLPKGSWTVNGLSHAFRSKVGFSEANVIETEIRAQMERLHQTIVDACKGKAFLPSPKEVVALFREEVALPSDVPLHQYAKQVVKRKIKYRTKQRYSTLATFLEIADQIRSRGGYRGLELLGRGPFFLQRFGRNDWHDLETILCRTTVSINKAYQQGGLKSLNFQGPPYYSTSTTVKFMKALKAILNDAKKNDDFQLKVDTNSLTLCVSPKSKPRPIITNEEFIHLASNPLASGKLERIRKLFLIQSLTGVRVSDLPKIFSSPIQTFTHEGSTVDVIKLRTQKTGKEVGIPVLPLLKNLLEQCDASTPISDQRYNDFMKELLRKMDFERKVTRSKHLPNGEWLDIEVPLWQAITSHSTRRFFYTLLTGHYGISPLLATKATGHSLDDRGRSDADYYSNTLEMNALSILQRIEQVQSNITSTLLMK